MPATTAHHQRNRSPGRGEAEQDQVEQDVDELRILWSVLSAALARDSIGQLTSDRQSKGAREGSAATVNVDVVDAAVLVETGVSKLLAEVGPLLNLDPSVTRTVAAALSLIPDWHRSLAGRGMPLAGYLRRDLKAWLRTVRQAIGVRRHDERLGSLCPDHRDEHPTGLRLEGAQATIASTLLAGPPRRWSPAPVGPVCQRCTAAASEDEPAAAASSRRTRRRRKRREQRHASCAAIEAWRTERRPVDLATGELSDWVRRGDAWAWLSLAGEQAWSWTESGAVTCPHCRRSWSTLGERRLLAAELKALGDQRNPSMEAIIR